MPVEDEEGYEAYEGYQAYDPAEVRPDRAEAVEADLPSALRDEDGLPLPGFDPRYSEDFEGLLYLGALSKSFTWLGHSFVVRTLTQGELLLVPQLIRDWVGTVGEAKAYTTAMAALATISVDGQELPIPIGDGQGEFSWAYQRFAYAKSNWFQFTIDRIYSEYLTLESRAQKVIDAMEKASGPVGSTDGSSDNSAGPNDEDS